MKTNFILRVMVMVLLTVVMVSCAGEYMNIPTKDDRQEIVLGDNAVKLHAHTQGEGIAVVLFAVGYDDEKEVLEQICDDLFAYEPYRKLKTFFDVYGIYITEDFPKLYIDSKNRIMTDKEQVCEIVRRELGVDCLWNMNLVVCTPFMMASSCAIISSDIHETLALCFYGNADRKEDTYILAHEVGGHSIAGLCDEYVMVSEHITEEGYDFVGDMQDMGKYLNISLSDNPEQVGWKKFLSMEQYDDVAIVEGGYYYQYGVWKSSEGNVMDCSGYKYSTFQRYCIWQTVHEKAKVPTTLSDFLEYDSQCMFSRVMVDKPSSGALERMRSRHAEILID